MKTSPLYFTADEKKNIQSDAVSLSTNLAKTVFPRLKFLNVTSLIRILQKKPNKV